MSSPCGQLCASSGWVQWVEMLEMASVVDEEISGEAAGIVEDREEDDKERR